MRLCRRESLLAETALALFCLLLPACSSLSDRILIDKTQEGAVYLERLPTRGTTAMFSGPVKRFQATQPILLPSDTLAQVFAGIQVSPVPAAGTARPVSLLSPSEIAFLAPLVSKALAQADKDQRVRFFLGPAGEGTSGLLFVHRPYVHFTLDHLEAGIAKVDSHTLAFSPEEASRTKDLPQSWMNIEPERPTVTVNYELLATLAPQPVVAEPRQQPPSQPAARAADDTNKATPAMAEELQSLRELVIKQAKELQTLKEEVKTLRRQTTDQKPSPRRRDMKP